MRQRHIHEEHGLRLREHESTTQTLKERMYLHVWLLELYHIRFKLPIDKLSEVAHQDECATIEGLSVPSESTVLGTLQMDEAPVCAEIPGDQSFYNIKPLGEGHDLSALLARPVLLNTAGLFATPGSVLDVQFGTSAQWRNAFGVTHWDRLTGYTGIRATLVFTCVVTKTAFHQGIIQAHFQYGIDQTDNRYRGRHFPLAVHLPHVRMNLAEQTMMTLRVPYVGTEEYIRIPQALGVDIQNYGVFGIVSLTGCRLATGQTTPTVTVYVHMEDVELIGPTPFSYTFVTTQSGGAKTSTASVVAKTVAKAGAVVKEAKEKKVISKTLGAASKVARVVSYVPGLGAFAGAADWFLSSSAKTAEALGFSKPADENPFMRHVRYSYGFDGQTDMPNTGVVLSAFQSNKLAIDPSVGCTDEDHMSFDYVLGKYSYIYRGNFFTTNVVGDVLYTAPVTPSAFWYRDRALSIVGATGNLPLKTGNTATENAFYPSTLCYVGDNFRYFRGGFVFRVSFATTKLHGGRVLFSFIPFRNNYAPGTPVSAIQAVPNIAAAGPTPTGYSLLFDLQDQTVFEFEVPFVYPDNYCNVLSNAIGSVSMAVVSPLSANNSVTTTVDFMVEVKAMPGFSFAVPTSSLMSGVPASGTVAVSLQSGVPVTEINPEAAQQSIGEEILSLKTLIQIPDYYTDNVANNIIYRVTPPPWFKPNNPALATPMSVGTVALYYASKSSRIADMYAYVRGGTVCIFNKDKEVNVPHLISFIPEDGGVDSATFSSFYDKNNNALGASTILENNVNRVILPTYSRYSRIPLSVRDSAFGGAYTAPTRNTWNQAITAAVPEVSISNVSGSNMRLCVGRAAADDAVCSQFIGPPPVIILNGLMTASPCYGNSRFF